METKTTDSPTSRVLESTPGNAEWRGVPFDVFESPAMGRRRPERTSATGWRDPQGKLPRQLADRPFAGYYPGVPADQVAFHGAVEQARRASPDYSA